MAIWRRDCLSRSRRSQAFRLSFLKPVCIPVHDANNSLLDGADTRQHDPFWHGADIRGCKAFLCSGTSNIHLFSNFQCVINLDSEIANGALDLLMSEQKLDS